MKQLLRTTRVSTSNQVSQLTLVLLLSLLFVSCSKEKNPPAPALPGKDLVSIVIAKADNAGYSDDGYVYIRGDKAYITLPPAADLSKVKATFKISEGAKLSIDNTPIPNLSGQFNLSNTVKAVVTSGSGASKTYLLLAQTGQKSLDKLIYEFQETYSIPGVSMAILKTAESRIVYASGFGFSDKEALTRTQPTHLFRLGSISKQFTSICIMKLIQQGRLTFDSRVFGASGVLKDQYADVSAMAAKVTIRNLLDHTSGWKSDPDPMFTSSFSGQSLDQRIQYVLTSPQVEPGTQFSYFNMGFGILGKVIEKVTGKSYESYLKEVLTEANITDIHVGKDRNGRWPNEVVYYSQDGYNGYANDMNVIAAAGGLIASTEQMLKLIPYIDGRPNPADILTPEIRTLMLTPSSNGDRYALGWRMNHRLFPGSWYHGGNLAGTATFWVMGPEYCTVILCNSRSYQTGFDDELYYLSEKLIQAADGLF